MKTAQRFSLALLFSSFIFSAASAQESPEMQFGVGMSTSSQFDAIHAAYAVTPAIHIGAQFGASSTMTTTEGSSDESNTGLTFAPYVKGLFFGLPSFKPFVEVQYAYTNTNTTVGSNTTSQPINTLWGSFGAEYFINRYIGLFGKFRAVSIDLTSVRENNGDQTKVSSFGILDTSVGIEWFF
ncbi:MAG: outer membrane beta-barrel protein [Bacteroidota bacterium]